MNMIRRPREVLPLMIAAVVIIVILITLAPAAAQNTPQQVNLPRCVLSETDNGMMNAANLAAAREECDTEATVERGFRHAILLPTGLAMMLPDNPCVGGGVQCAAPFASYTCLGVGPEQLISFP